MSEARRGGRWKDSRSRGSRLVRTAAVQVQAHVREVQQQLAASGMVAAERQSLAYAWAQVLDEACDGEPEWTREVANGAFSTAEHCAPEQCC